MSKRKVYPKEFKLDAVNLVLEQGYTKAEAARSLSINQNMLGRWIKELESELRQVHRLRKRRRWLPVERQCQVYQRVQ